MKIALVTSFPTDPLAPRGGVEAVSVNLVAALARQPGVDVHVVTTDRKCAQNIVLKWEGATIHRLPMPNERLLSYIRGAGHRAALRYLDEIRPDVVHAHDFYGMMLDGLRFPRVFTIHGFIHEDTKFAGGRFAAMRSRLWQYYEIASWRKQPHIIAISPYVRERLRGIATGVIHDIENPINLDNFALAPAEELGTIFSAAVITPRKNTLGLVNAFARVAKTHPQAKLRLAGGSPIPQYYDTARKAACESGLETRISFLGAIGAKAIQQELSRATAFALVSFEEGAPMGIAEAMAAQLPVVTSNRCGMPYMIRHAESGYLVDPNNVEEIATSLSALLANDKLRRKMGSAAKSFAADRFHPDRVAERTMRVYRTAMRA